MSKRLVRVALLLCDTPVPKVLEEIGDYHVIYRHWLETALASYPDPAIAQNTELVLDAYDVVGKGEYPTANQLTGPGGYDAVMMTGSKHSAYDETPWIIKLIAFIRETATSPSTQHVKIVGVCFGHQIVAMALGGRVVPGTNGWEIGVYGNEMTDAGRYWWTGSVEGQGGNDKLYIQQMHRDHVPEVPPGFELLLSSPRYPVHSMIKLHPSSTTSKPIAHVLTIQGHPEYTPEIVAHMVDTRSASGLFDGPTTAEARRRLGGKQGSGGEGFERAGWAVWRVIMQEIPGNDEPMDGAVANGASLADEERHRHVDAVLEAPGPWTGEHFLGGEATRSFLRTQAKILVIGAGGLGCEILQNLALVGFADIHVIDMDTIDISNLNRQFLFREADVGKSKALVAAEFVMSRVPGVKVTPYHGKIQDHPESFYMQFNLVVAGLDSISARRWINATLVGMVDGEDPESLKPLIDGGTEGQARVILPTVTSCYECSIDMLTPPTAFPICTIANTPRLPEHCIEWASVLEWPKTFADKKLDTDDPDHIEWLYQKAFARATEFNIEGVTWALTQGVVKNIIPAIASTNAIIAALKIATACAPFLDNYMMYTGNDSVYAYTFEHEKREDCPVCGDNSITAEIKPDWTVGHLLEWLEGRQDLQIKRPSLAYESGKPLFFQAPPALYDATKANLDKPVGELVRAGESIIVTDPGLPFSLTVEVKYV